MPLSDADKIINLEDLAAFKAKMDESVLHKTGTETVSGEKVFSGSQSSEAGNIGSLLVVKDSDLVKGETPEKDHYLSIGFIDSTGNSYVQDSHSRLGVVEYKSPSEINPRSYMQMVDMGFNGGGDAVFRVGHDENNIRYATVPSTSEDRVGGTDIVTRDYLPKSKAIPQFPDLWNWQKTEKAEAVTLKPVSESDLEPVVDFLFSETPPASGDKGPENPSTITGVTQAKLTRCGKNIIPFPYRHSSRTADGITWTVNEDRSITANGTATVNTLFIVWAGGAMRVPRGVTCTLSGCPSTGSYDTYYIQCGDAFFDIGAGRTFSFSSNHAQYMQIVIKSGVTVNNVVFRPQLELGSIATSFESYEGNDYTIQLGDAYYGGSLDVATGVLTVTHSKITATSAAAISSTSGDFIGANIGTDVAVKADNTQLCCDKFAATTSADEERILTRGSDVFYSVRLYILKSRLDFSSAVDPSSPTDAEVLAALNAWLLSNPIEIVFMRTVPFTVQLTPTQIRSLPVFDKYEPRVNTVYTDQELVQVGYQRYAGGAVKALRTTAARTLPERFADVVNVKDFGAKGDGSLDDPDAVADAFAAADGSTVFFPSSHGENYGVELYNVYRNPENLYNRSSGLMFLSGTSSAPTSDPHAIIVAEKNSSAATADGAAYSTWDNGAIYAQLNQISGDAYGAAVTGFVRSVGADGGQLIGVHGRGSAAASDSQVWGGWFYAAAGAAGCKHLIGAEININNKSSAGDPGWGVSLGSARGLVVTAADGSSVPGLVGISIGAQTGSVGWHTGLTVYGDAVVTNTARAENLAAVGDNEAIHLPGTTNANSYGGIRFGDARTNINHYFWYGISFKEATFSNNCAILLGEGQKIKVGSDGSSICGMAFSRTNVCVNFENMVLRINNKQVVGERKTGWMTANTGTPSKEPFDAATVTTEQLACRVIALINDLKAHGLIGVS